MALNQREISELYVAIFNRASEGDGNDFWQALSQEKSAFEVAEAMIDSPAGQAYFGDSIDENKAFIEHIYLNTLGKTAEEDPDGVAFWTGLLDDGMPRGEAVVKFIEIVQSDESIHEGGDLNAAIIPHAVKAQEQFENRTVVSTTMADHVQSVPGVVNEDGSINQEVLDEMTLVKSFTDIEPTTDAPHGVQGAEGIAGNHGGVKAGTGSNQLFVTDNDQTKSDAIQDILDGDYDRYNYEKNGPIKLTTGVDGISGRDDSDNVSGESDNLMKVLSRYDDAIDAKTVPGSLQLTDAIVDPSTQDNDTLEVELNSNLGVNDPNGDIIGTGNTTDVGFTPVTFNTDGSIKTAASAPQITNIEQITLHNDGSVGVFNTSGIKNNVNLNVDRADSSMFNSLNDRDTLEIVNLDGNQIQSLNAIERTKYLNVSDIRDTSEDKSNTANIVLQESFLGLAVDSYAEDGQKDDAVNIYMEGADFELGLFDDDDNDDTAENDGGQFAEMTLFSNGDSTVTLTTGTALNNRTDNTRGDGGTDAALRADEDTNNSGLDATSQQGSMRTIVPNDGDENSLLTQSLLLDSETATAAAQDAITLVGTAIQFDEAVIKEVDEGTEDKLDTTIDVTFHGAEEVSSVYAGGVAALPPVIVGMSGPLDLTRAQVDLVKVKAMGMGGADQLITEYMELDVDQDSIVEVNAIHKLDALVITGDHQYDVLDIHINTGGTDAVLGRLVLGGDASATTTDFTNTAGTGAIGSESASSDEHTDPDLSTDDAASAIITVEDTSSRLGVLDISQISGKSVKVVGDKDLTIHELIMGNHGPGRDSTNNEQANKIDAREMTGDFKATLATNTMESIDGRELTSGGLDAHNDGNGKDEQAGWQGRGFGVTMELGSGDDFIQAVGVVAHADGGWDHGDNIALGAGDDKVVIGSFFGNNSNGVVVPEISGTQISGAHLDDAVAAEIWGQEGDDTFTFASNGDTDHGNHEAGVFYSFLDTGTLHSTGPTPPNLTGGTQDGVSLVQIEDFEAGSNGDQIGFEIFRDVDSSAVSTFFDTAATGPSLFHDGEIISASSKHNYLLSDGEVALVSVADIDGFSANDIVGLFGDNLAGNVTPTSLGDDSVVDLPVVGIPGTFEDPDYGEMNAPQSNYMENIFIVGETSGTDGVKIFYFREGSTAAPDETAPMVDAMAANLIGQLNGINVTDLQDDNFDFQ